MCLCIPLLCPCWLLCGGPIEVPVGQWLSWQAPHPGESEETALSASSCNYIQMQIPVRCTESSTNAWKTYFFFLNWKTRKLNHSFTTHCCIINLFNSYYLIVKCHAIHMFMLSKFLTCDLWRCPEGSACQYWGRGSTAAFPSGGWLHHADRGQHDFVLTERSVKTGFQLGEYIIKRIYKSGKCMIIITVNVWVRIFEHL